MEHNNITLTIKLTNDLIEKKANNLLEKYNITLSQARILSVLYHSNADSLSFKALEKMFSVSQATMQGTVSRLAKKGFVKTQYLADDRKTKYVFITNEGKLLVAGFSKSIGEINHTLTESLTKEEIEALSHIMTKLHRSLVTM